MRTCIKSPNIPLPVGPFSQAVKHNGFLYISGQISVNPKTGEIEKTDIAGQTRRILENMKILLEDAGTSMNDVIKCTIFLSSLDDFNKMNEVYGQFFKENPPARVTVGVNEIYAGLSIEMDAVAAIDE